MKKTAAIIFLTLFAVVLLNLAIDGGSGAFEIDGDHIGGPLGALLAVVFGGGGILLAGAIMLIVGVVLAAVFASLGVVAIAGIAIGALALVLAMSPLLLPLLVPVAIIWWFAGRAKRNRMVREAAV